MALYCFVCHSAYGRMQRNLLAATVACGGQGAGREKWDGLFDVQADATILNNFLKRKWMYILTISSVLDTNKQ